MNVRYAILVPVLLLAQSALLADDSKLLEHKTTLGRALFHDTTLSEPTGQACASCHRPDQFFADPVQTVSAGANPKRFGNRNAPSISYIKFNPEPSWNAEDETWIGGFFLDGRARTLQEQAQGPFLNPLEMNNADARAVITKVKQRPYASQLTAIYGKDIWKDHQKAFDAIADALAAFEQHGSEFAPFSSKYDAYLNGKATLTAQEQRGLKLFEDEKKGNCAACHPSQRGKDGSLPLFTDFSYDNIGVPRHPRLPFYRMPVEFNPAGKQYRDPGLGDTAYAKARNEQGKFKVQTLRNIANTAPYMHNGVFTTLKEAVEFYNTRDTDKKWGEPEVAENLNSDELGDLKLTWQEVDDLVAFLKTLSDGYVSGNDHLLR